MVDTRSDDGYVVVGTHGCGVFSTKITSLYKVPGKPSLVSPVNNTKGQLNDVPLSWNSVPDAVYYTVQVSTDAEFKNVVWQNNGAKTTNETFDSPEPGLKDYYWRVYAKNAGGWSLPSETWSFRTAVGAPTLIFPENASINMPQTITLRWRKNPAASKYHIQVSTNLSFTKKIADTIIIADSSFMLTNLEENKKYYWKVSSIDNDGEGLPSQIFNFKTFNSQSVGEISYYHHSGLIKNVYPNPGNNVLTVGIEPAITGHVSVRLYNIKGELKRIINDGTLFSGAYEIKTNISDLPEGKYFIEVQTSGMYDVKSIIILR